MVQKRDIPWVSSVDRVPWDLRGTTCILYLVLGKQGCGGHKEKRSFPPALF